MSSIIISVNKSLVINNIEFDISPFYKSCLKKFSNKNNNVFQEKIKPTEILFTFTIKGYYNKETDNCRILE